MNFVIDIVGLYWIVVWIVDLQDDFFGIFIFECCVQGCDDIVGIGWFIVGDYVFYFDQCCVVIVV